VTLVPVLDLEHSLDGLVRKPEALAGGMTE
jgi:hypothetical protein